MSPTQRSLKLLRDDGWTAEVVERWNPHAKIRQDLFGFADLIAIKWGWKPILIQVTSTGIANRVAKIKQEERAYLALHAGFDVQAHGWRKIKVKRGGKAYRWAPRIFTLKPEDFPCHFKPTDTLENFEA